eukprot:6466375-Amphidinium_carterae.1
MTHAGGIEEAEGAPEGQTCRVGETRLPHGAIEFPQSARLPPVRLPDISFGSKIWIHKVGMFGLGSAACWWARLAFGVARWCWALKLLDAVTMLKPLVSKSSMWTICCGLQMGPISSGGWYWRCLLGRWPEPLSVGKVKGGLNLEWM